MFSVTTTKVALFTSFLNKHMPDERGCFTPTYLIDNLLDSSLVNIHIKHKCSHTLACSQWFIYIFLPQNSLLPVLPSCSFQVPSHLAKFLATMHKSITHLPEIVDNQIYSLKCLLRLHSSGLSCQSCLLWASTDILYSASVKQAQFSPHS